MDGQQWLDSVFTPVLVQDSLAYPFVAELVRGQLTALHDCGVLDDDAVGDASRRLGAAVAAARERQNLVLHPADWHGSVPTVQLVRVLGVGQGLADVGGIPVVLASVELWANRVVVLLVGLPTVESEREHDVHEAALQEWSRQQDRERHHAGSSRPPQLRTGLLQGTDLRLRDDLDTRYRWTGGGSERSRTDWRMRWVYAPAVPDHAKRLTIEVVGGDSAPVGQVEVQLA